MPDCGTGFGVEAAFCPFDGIALKASRWDPAFKTTLVCVLGNEPGTLVRALVPFSSRGLNLCRIESHPTRETPFEYAFHLDVAPAGDAAQLSEAIDDVRRVSRAVRVLGHYPSPADRD